MKAAVRIFLSVAIASMVCACSDMNTDFTEDTKTVATATGGAIGAGLGAIVGSQTGNAGAGLVIGAAAGSGAGYLVGQSLEDSQERARASDELIGQRGAMIKTQRKEIDSLRAVHNTDAASAHRPNTYGRVSQDKRAAVAEPVRPTNTSGSIREKADWYRNQQATDATTVHENETAATLAPAAHSTPECAEGEKEFFKGRGAVQSSEKLLALRRAVRLCPQDVRFQLALGQAYRSADKKEDAVYQYRQALQLDPKNATAQQALREIGK